MLKFASQRPPGVGAVDGWGKRGRVCRQSLSLEGTQTARATARSAHAGSGSSQDAKVEVGLSGDRWSAKKETGRCAAGRRRDHPRNERELIFIRATAPPTRGSQGPGRRFSPIDLRGGGLQGALLDGGPLRVRKQLRGRIRAGVEKMMVERSLVLQPPANQRKQDHQRADRHAGAVR